MGAMAAVKVEERDGCAENRQPLASPSPSTYEGGGYGALTRMSPFSSSPAESMSGRRYCSSSSSSANRLRLCCSVYWIVVAFLTRMLSSAWVGLWLG